MNNSRLSDLKFEEGGNMISAVQPQNEYCIQEFFKQNSYFHIRDKSLPMNTRIYISLVHMHMWYKRMFCNSKVVLPLNMYISAILIKYTEYPKVDSPFSADVVVELIKLYGVLRGFIRPGYTYIENSIKKQYKQAAWLTDSEITELIDNIIENNKEDFE
jgi:hypothetical protein